MNNEEKIRDMSTWDLAEFIFKVSNGETRVSTCNNDCAKCEYTDSYCTFQIAEWLREKSDE